MSNVKPQKKLIPFGWDTSKFAEKQKDWPNYRKSTKILNFKRHDDNDIIPDEQSKQ